MTQKPSNLMQDKEMNETVTKQIKLTGKRWSKALRIVTTALMLFFTVPLCMFGVSTLLNPMDMSTLRGRSWSTLLFYTLLMLFPLLAIGTCKRRLFFMLAFFVSSAYAIAWSVFWWQWEILILGTGGVAAYFARIAVPYFLIYGLIAISFLLTHSALVSGLHASRRWFTAVVSLILSISLFGAVLHITHAHHFETFKARANIGRWAMEMSQQSGKTPEHYIHLYNRLANKVSAECLRRAQPGEDPSKYWTQVWKEFAHTTIVSSASSNTAPDTGLKAVKD